jgi:splicing factor 3A subunit 3
MDSVFELQRQTHEEVEHFQRALYDLLSRPPTTHDRRLQNEHKASRVLDRITNRTTALDNLYADEDARKADIALLSAPQRPDDLSEFYSRLVKIQEHHNKYPDSAPGIDLELASFLDEPGQEEDDFEEEDRAPLLPVITHSPSLTVYTRSNLAHVLR